MLIKIYSGVPEASFTMISLHLYISVNISESPPEKNASPATRVRMPSTSAWHEMTLIYTTNQRSQHTHQSTVINYTLFSPCWRGEEGLNIYSNQTVSGI